MNKRMGLAVALVLIAVVPMLVAPPAVFALATEYNRNGEVYLLIGQGTAKGVYRLNDPAGEGLFLGFLFYPQPNPSIPFPGKTVSTAMSISVDLNRNVRTFCQVDDNNWVLKSGNIPRQVAMTLTNGKSQGQADYGWHHYYHADCRGYWGDNSQVGKPIYRVAGAPFAANPGAAIAEPPVHERFPAKDGGGNILYYPGQAWYSIPNGSWYQGWETSGTIGGGVSYRVARDVVNIKAHDWHLLRWYIGAGNYPIDDGITCTSSDVSCTHYSLFGCIDPCGPAAPPGTTPAKDVYQHIAFTPAQGGQLSRTYMYWREQTTPSYSITITYGSGSPGNYSGIKIGIPDDVGSPDPKTGTRWIGVSLKNPTEDFVYTLGNKTISQWYQAQTGAAPPSGFNVNAVTVSNQWNQKGGIVYAYDKTQGWAYKFQRNDTAYAGPADNLNPAFITSYEPINLGSDIDDIKADGFGNLYYGKTTTTPSAAPSGFNLDNDVVAMKDLGPDGYGFYTYEAVYCQATNKSVFQRLVVNPTPAIIGSKNLGNTYYVRYLKVPMTSASAAELLVAPYYNTSDPSGPGFTKRMTARGGSWFLGWQKDTVNYPDTSATADKVEIGVINVPTPPKIYSFPGYASRLDLVGPYSSFPVPNYAMRHTNQSSNLLPGTVGLNPSTLYFYMVENYPLADGPQDPTIQTDWNGNGYAGGFITAIVPGANGLVESTTNGGRLFYRWILWTVQDSFGQVIDPASYSDPQPLPDYPTDPQGDRMFGFYSPVGGKYILTCQVKYDWYNYDSLPFGSFIQNVDSCRRNGSAAVSLGKGTLVGNIQAKWPFMSWATMSSVLNSQIIPDNTWAAIPIEVPFNLPPPPPVMYNAKIERCDNPTVAPASQIWAARPCTGVATTTHIVYAGKQGGGGMGPSQYGWRVEQNYQRYMFFDISTSNQTANSSLADYNFVAHELVTNYPGNPLYFSPASYPNLEFRNRIGDTAWAENIVTYEGSLLMPLPNGGTQKIILFGNSTNPRVSYTAPPPAPPAPQPPYAGVCDASSLIPTDPKSGKLEIKMSRRFKWRVFPYQQVGAQRIYYSPTWLYSYLNITAQSDIVTLDQNAPVLLQDATVPRNLFGFAGSPLVAGVGPNAGNRELNNNNASGGMVLFQFRDNNAWENGTLTGLTEAQSALNRASNAGYTGVNMKATYDLKLIYARNNRRTSLQYFVISDPISHSPASTGVTVGAPTVGGVPAATHYTYKEGATVRALKMRSFAASGIPYGDNLPANANPVAGIAATQSAFFAHHFNCADLCFTKYGNQLYPQLPPNYANNSAGYAPIPFTVGVSDCSGNAATYPLNLVVNIRDNTPPLPWATIIDQKVGASRVFPVYSPPAPFASVTAPVFVDTDPTRPKQTGPVSIVWTPDTNTAVLGNLGLTNDFGAMPPYFAGLWTTKPKLLKSVGALTKQVNDSTLFDQAKAGVLPGYVEDNVEFVITPYVSDNAGTAVASLTLVSVDSGGNAVTVSANSDAVNVAQRSVFSIFRGADGVFPVAAPLTMVADDNALQWTYVANRSNINDTAWTYGAVDFTIPPNLTASPMTYFVLPVTPLAQKNRRTINTTVLGFDSRMLIRTLDKRIQNK